MSPLDLIFSVLKEQLKTQGKTYAGLALYLDLSESSVKRLFMNQTLSLVRLQEVCRFLGMELFDVMQLADQRVERISHLSRDQEQMLVSDIPLLIVAISVLNGWIYDQIVAHYQFTPAACVQYLLTLNQLHIIELLANNQFKLLVAHNFSWRANGPIEQFFHQHLRHDFFASRFRSDNESFLCLNGMLSAEDSVKLQKKIEQLKDFFSELHHRSLSLPINQKDGCALVMAQRPWVPKIFEQYQRSS